MHENGNEKKRAYSRSASKEGISGSRGHIADSVACPEAGAATSGSQSGLRLLGIQQMVILKK